MSGRYCLVKGSPEALQPLLKEGNTPEWYWSSYNALAEEGMRVLALAYRRVTAEDLASIAADSGNEKPEENRKWVESSLEFAGFIAFTCSSVVLALQERRVVVVCEAQCAMLFDALPGSSCRRGPYSPMKSKAHPTNVTHTHCSHLLV